MRYYDVSMFVSHRNAQLLDKAAHPSISKVKQQWMDRHNNPTIPMRTEQQGMEEADAYEAAEHNPNDPNVQASYQELLPALVEQYNDLRTHGLNFTPYSEEGEPYENSDAMRADLSNGQLQYRPTAINSDLDSGHPMSATVMTVDGPMLANDVFRIVHDALGHGEGASFGPQGEQQAWMNHRSTLPAEAHPALWTETRGQNVWTNYGKHMRDEGGKLLPKNQRPSLTERPFAKQKSTYLKKYANSG